MQPLNSRGRPAITTFPWMKGKVIIKDTPRGGKIVNKGDKKESPSTTNPFARRRYGEPVPATHDSAASLVIEKPAHPKIGADGKKVVAEPTHDSTKDGEVIAVPADGFVIPPAQTIMVIQKASSSKSDNDSE